VAVPTTFRRHRRALGRELRGLREGSGRTGNQFARELGWAQSKVSRLETGAQIATEQDLEVWCKVLGATRGDYARLLSLLGKAEAEYLGWKESYRLAGDGERKQEEILRYERLSRRIVEFQPSIVPGLLQTQAYAGEILRSATGPAMFGATEGEIERMIAVRMRRQEVLYDRTKDVRVIILESVLRTAMGPGPVMVEQLLRLRDLHRFTSARLAIIPNGARVPIIPLGGFTVYDDDLVVLETLSGEQHLSGGAEVSAYSKATALLESAAVEGDDAGALIERVITEGEA